MVIVDPVEVWLGKMKQEITIEQRNELSPKARDRLIEWCFEHTPRQRLKSLSIGEMIEFLIARAKGFDTMCSWDDEDGGWKVGYLSSKYVEVMNYRTLSPVKAYPEICDALWEAVKEVLENEQH